MPEAQYESHGLSLVKVRVVKSSENTSWYWLSTTRIGLGIASEGASLAKPFVCKITAKGENIFRWSFAMVVKKTCWVVWVPL